MDREHGIVRDILLWLWQGHSSWLNNDASAPERELHDKLARNHTPFGQVDLEIALRKESIQSVDRFIFLQPPGRGGLILPILNVNWNFGLNIPIIRLRLSLFGLNQGRLIDMGFRFESPEGTGNHNYYHAQPILPLGASTTAWPPTRFPTFTLDARNPVTLLSCMLISLYGQDYLGQLSSARFRDYLRPHVNEMHWTDFRLGRHYREDRDQYGINQNDGRWRWSP